MVILGDKIWFRLWFRCHYFDVYGMDHLCKSPLSKKQRKEIMSSSSDSSKVKMNKTFRIGIHLLVSQDGRVSTIFRQSLRDIMDGIDKQTIVNVDIVKDIAKSEIILCVLDDVSNEDQVSNI